MRKKKKRRPRIRVDLMVWKRMHKILKRASRKSFKMTSKRLKRKVKKSRMKLKKT